MKAAAVREVALDAALEALAGGRARERVHAAPLPAAQKALAERIAVGAIKHHLGLSNAVAAFVRRRHRSRRFEEILRQAMYQLWYMSTEPAVAVDAAVELAKRISSTAAATVNAVLRRAAAVAIERRSGAPPRADWRRALHVASTEGGPGYLYLPQRILRKDPQGELESVCGLPAWLAWRYYKRCGEARFWRLVDWANSAPPFTVRINTLKLGRQPAGWDLAAIFAGAERFERLEMPGLAAGFFRLEGAVVSSLPGLAAGLFSVQDAANALAAEALRVEPGVRVLDMCAAPGAKTAQIAEKLENRGEIIACDINAERLQLVRENAQRAGASCIRAVALDATQPPAEWRDYFDRVIIDTPCSNTGALSRRPEARLRVSQAALRELADKQRRLLNAGLRVLKPGGVLVYSTCSLEPEENERIIDTVQERCEVFDERLTEPELGMHDGGYFAALRKG